MGKRHRNQHQRDGQSARVRLEQLLAKGDTRAAVEAAKLLVREEPGAASEALAVQAYAERIKALIAEGLGREAAAIASIVRERFPAQVASQATALTALLDDARLAAGDFDWILSELRESSEERRAGLEERLLPWIADPGALARSAALDPADPLSREARIVAELFETVTSRVASPEEMAALNDIRRRSPLAPWKLLVRAIDAFHREDDDRVAANVTAIDLRSPAARAGAVLTELTAGAPNRQRSFAAERLIDRISGGRATIAAQIRRVEAASKEDDRRTMREEVRALSKLFDTVSPYAREQLRIALLPIIGLHFGAEQTASLFRISEDDPEMERYGALLTESTGMPNGAATWVAYAGHELEDGHLEPWQAAEIYLHALSIDDDADDDDPFICMDPTHDHPVAEPVDTAGIIEKIVQSRPAPAVLDRLTPHLDQLQGKELRRVLTAWRKTDPDAPQPLVRLLRLAARERRYDDALSLVRQGDRMKTIDPEYGRIRLRVLLRKAEQLLAARSRDAAATILAEVAAADRGEDAATYLLALQWAASPPAAAGDFLAQLAGRGVAGEVVLAEVTGTLGLPFALPASHPSPEEMLEGLVRGLASLEAVEVAPRHCSWLLERTKPYLDRADERQLLTVGTAAMACGMNDLAWAATTRGLESAGPMLHRMLLLRAELLIATYADPRRTVVALGVARALAQRAHDPGVAARAAELEHGFRFIRFNGTDLSQDEIASIVEEERADAMPAPRKQPRKKKPRPAKSKPAPKPRNEKGLFEP